MRKARKAKPQRNTTLWTRAVELSAIVGAIGVVIAAAGVWLQYRQYNEEVFHRRQNAIALAWNAIRDAAGYERDVGQTSALEYLAELDLLDGNVSLNGTILAGLNFRKRLDGSRLKLHESAFCDAGIYLLYAPKSTFDRTLFRRSGISADWTGASLVGADLSFATLIDLKAARATLVGANLNGARILAGVFTHADLRLVDLRNSKTLEVSTVGTPNADKPLEVGPNQNIDEFRARVFFGRWLATEGAKPTLTDFTGAQFHGADLRGADLAYSNLSQPQLDQACADAKTILPKGLILKSACTNTKWITDQQYILRNGLQTSPHEADCEKFKKK